MITYYNYPSTLTDPFNSYIYGQPSCSYIQMPLDRIFEYNQRLANEGRREEKLKEERLRLQVSVDVIENHEKYMIRLFKRWGNFKDYEVRVVRNKKGDTVLKIKGNLDDFNKEYLLDLDALDITKINWNYAKERNLLILDIPKRIHQSVSHDENKLKKITKCNSRSERRRKHKSSSKRKRRELEDHGKVLQSSQNVPLDQKHLSDDIAREMVPDESSSKVEEIKMEGTKPILDNNIRKLHKPTLEEVPDEEFSSSSF